MQYQRYTSIHSFIGILAVSLLLMATSSCNARPSSVHAPSTPMETGIPLPLADQFSGLPFHLLGQPAGSGGYDITLSNLRLELDSLMVSATLENHSSRIINLDNSFFLYQPDGSRVIDSGQHGTLASGSATALDIRFDLPASIPVEGLLEYRLLYTPFGWSGPVFMYLLVDELPESSPQPGQVVPGSESPQAPGAYDGITGDPWKMLVLIYPNIDTDYVEGGVAKHLTASMPAVDLANMRNNFESNLPHRNVVYGYSGHTGEMEAHVVVVDRALTDLEPISTGFWPSPDVVRTELDLYAPAGKYDSVIVFWQASDPNTGQSLPVYGWGLGYWPGNYANGMTYATVFNIGWYWPGDACHGEVFLHEWLHGVTGFYMDHLGFPFNVDDLHGAEEAGYQWDYNEDGCWDNWLHAYMQGLVYESGLRKALVPETWQSGSITTHHIYGWRGEYYNDTSLTGIPVLVSDDAVLDFEWQGGSPHPLVLSDAYSARWTKMVTFTAGQYEFNIEHDDGGRLYIDDELVFENWCDNCWETDSVIVLLDTGSHVLKMEMWENQGWSAASLNWHAADLPLHIFLPVLKK